MQGSRTALKVISILLIIYAIVMIAFGAFMCLGGALPGAVGQTVDVDGMTVSLVSAALVIGLVGILGGIINLIVGLLGMRGAKNPAKIGPFCVLAIIGLVFAVLSLLGSIMQGTFQPSSLIGLAFNIICVALGLSIKKYARDRSLAQY